ncbi:hypothetical protein G4V39_03745 [Thermosulfuriphilus ammonigenes]|uniref:Uncharacterized protein n=1 Tax=Thermosulfuriphilus ammonigenes TaxID=1936021 RepID=A0A6G7PV95_9BACT|nr:hypothetical protein [Thermosulfuriphilus ammonigenes]MBA2848403.1 hypothetical protein [Thermosulfuriphilus ammonigenes]QIJ71441.1 hypothetical protein G4V39_03745 [Thermosulfuriphilus ammonigenes]
MKRLSLLFLVALFVLGVINSAKSENGAKTYPPTYNYNYGPTYNSGPQGNMMNPNMMNQPVQGGQATIRGRVLDINPPVARVQGEDGQVYNVRLGPIWYWRDNNYSLSTGEQVEIIGYRQGNLIFPRLIRANGREITLRDQNGFPLWRGHGPCCGRHDCPHDDHDPYNCPYDDHGNWSQGGRGWGGWR